MTTYIQPGIGRVLVQPSPVDAGEEQRSSGLIVRRFNTHTKVQLLRGIVVRCGAPTMISEDPLSPGTIVFYSEQASWAVHDLIVVSYENIWAWEVEE